MRKTLVISAILALAVAAPAAAYQEPDWPCVQRKVAHLSWGQMWAGPPLPEDGSWREDESVARLAAILAARRTSLEEAEALVAGFGADNPETRDARLVALFAGAFELIDRERSRLIDGITRYSRKQAALTDRIDAERLEVEKMRAEVKPDDYDALDAIEELEDKVAWDTRIYQDRRKSLIYVCESPVVLEKRAFALARIIQGALSGQ